MNKDFERWKKNTGVKVGSKVLLVDAGDKHRLNHGLESMERCVGSIGVVTELPTISTDIGIAIKFPHEMIARAIPFYCLIKYEPEIK